MPMIEYTDAQLDALQDQAEEDWNDLPNQHKFQDPREAFTLGWLMGYASRITPSDVRLLATLAPSDPHGYTPTTTDKASSAED